MMHDNVFLRGDPMPNIDIPPDEASSFSLARTRAELDSLSADPTILGWLGRSLLVVLLLGSGLVVGGMLGPALYRLLS
jgi:hypothetical protein